MALGVESIRRIIHIVVLVIVTIIYKYGIQQKEKNILTLKPYRVLYQNRSHLIFQLLFLSQNKIKKKKTLMSYFDYIQSINTLFLTFKIK